MGWTKLGFNHSFIIFWSKSIYIVNAVKYS